MNAPHTLDREKYRKDSAKKAVALAMRSRWDEAAAVNLAITQDFPDDLEAYNRLGKALSELGRNGEAKEAFQRALEISPHNGIARKNLDRLTRLGDETGTPSGRGSADPHAFIEESGKAGVTSLINLAAPDVLLKLAPGQPVQLEAGGTGLKVTGASGESVGQVEPKLASRLTKLIGGGNKYGAAVTSVSERELTIIIREEFTHPSQTGIVSFPSRGGADYRVYTPGTLLGYETGEEEGARRDPGIVKDWSEDDTEPGDDDAFTPVVHRIINPASEAMQEGEDDF